MRAGARLRARARRLLWRARLRSARRGLHLTCMGLALLAPAANAAEMIVSARYTEPTTRYAHGVLGDAIEHGALEIRTKKTSGEGLSVTAVGQTTTHLVRLPQERVFEDTEPRIVDVDGDGLPEVVVVESHQQQGARLAIYSHKGLLAAIPYIGTRNRWLAPVAIADLDGDGLVELAYIDRPHLAKTLRVWRFEDGALTQVTALEGLTNHRIGERDIAGGLRECGNGPEMIVAEGNWRRLVAVKFDGTRLAARAIGPHEGRDSFARALACR